MEEQVFGPLVPGRDCGACTACCVEIAIDDPALTKPAGVRCDHCVDAGCAIYADRPADCRSWYCGWRRLAELPDDLRPDACGIMACLMERTGEANPLLRLYVVAQWLDGAPIARSEAADALLARLRRLGLPVWVGSGDRISLHFPRQEVALHLINGTSGGAAEAQELAFWRQRLGL